MNNFSSPRSRRRPQARAAFTLLEIIIAIALVAIGALGGTLGSNQEKIARTWVKDTAKTGLVPYRVDVGSFPSTEEGLKALVSPPSGTEGRWKGPYFDEVPTDPWGSPYQYQYPGSKNPSGARGYDVWSYGPDKTPNTTDDIGNWSE